MNREELLAQLPEEADITREMLEKLLAAAAGNDVVHISVNTFADIALTAIAGLEGRIIAMQRHLSQDSE